MCLDKIERSNFLRFLCVFIDIGTETLLRLFLHFVRQEDLVSFFSSDDVQRKCKDLQARKILTKQQLKIISHSCPDIHAFDISLFIVLLSNLFPESVITPPQGGWETNRPRKNDHSLAANIVRLRLLRNSVVGHSSRAKLSDIYFQDLWEDLKAIVVSIFTVIDTNSLDDISGKVESYKTIQLDAHNESQYEDKLRDLKETCIDIVEMQEKVADLLQKCQEFAKFFRCQPKRFSRYINLLFDGGRLVLRACLQKTLSKLNLDIHSVLSDKNEVLTKEIGGAVQQLNEAIDEWNVQALTTVMLVCFGDTVEPEVKEAIEYIQDSLHEYARLAVESLDAERFSHIDGDLVYNLRILSLDLGTDIQSKCKEMIDTHRKSQREENDSQCEDSFDLLKSHGLKLKSLEDVYKETLMQLREKIKEMGEKGIPFKNDYVLQLQLMTYGEKKKMAEDILTTVITAALQNDESTAECDDIRKAIDLILAQINKISGVKVETVERHCILISMSCSSSLGVLKLIEHIDGTYFQEQLYMLSSELIPYFGEELVVSGNFNFETLHDLAIYVSSCCRSEHEPGGLTLPVTCSSAEGMNQLLKLMTADATTNIVDQIAEQLSVQLQDKISLEVDFPDLREFIRELGDNEQDHVCSRGLWHRFGRSTKVVHAVKMGQSNSTSSSSRSQSSSSSSRSQSSSSFRPPLPSNASGQWQYRLLYIDYEEDKKVSISQCDIRDMMKHYIDDLSEYIIDVRAYKTKLSSLQLTMFVFFHMFVVFKTEKWFYSIEKDSEVITLQRSKHLQTLLQKKKFSNRTSTPCFMKWDSGRRKVKDLIDWIYNENEINYSYLSTVMYRNCQSFGERVYVFLTGNN